MDSFKECEVCILNSSIPEFRLDSSGTCNYCEDHKKLNSIYKIEEEKILVEKYKKLREKNSNKYDCLVGISGGVDSCYTLHFVKKVLNLNPLVIHYDDGWNTEIASKNIKNMISKLGVDYITYVNDWNDMQKLYKSFFLAKVPDPGVPGDLGIFGAIFKTCNQENIKNVFFGQSFRTEGTQPREWSFIDGSYVKSIYKKYGDNSKLENYPNINFIEIAYNIYFKRIKTIPILNYINYSKENAKKFLINEYKFEDYGGYHFENSLSKFINKYYNKNFLNFDRDIISLSAKIREGKLSKNEAKQILNNEKPLDQNFVNYCLMKLRINEIELQSIINSKPKNYKNFFTSYNIISKFKFILKLLVKMRLFNPILYNKYVK